MLVYLTVQWGQGDEEDVGEYVAMPYPLTVG